MNSKQKGGSFERLICRKLSLWVSSGAKDDLFWRSAMSGGRATLARKRGDAPMRVAGDIAAVSPEGHVLTDRYYIECKHLKSLDLTALVCTGRGCLVTHWERCFDEAKHHNRQPMLIVKQNKQPILVLTENCPLNYYEAMHHLHSFTINAWITRFDDMISRPYETPRLVLTKGFR